MTYDEIIEQLEITKSKIKEIARNEYGGESWNDDLDALTEAADIVADYSKATAQASEMSQKYEQPAMAVRRAAGLYTCPLCGQHNAAWTKTEDDKLRYLLSKGTYTYSDLAAELRHSEGAIKRRILDLGINKKPVRCPPPKMDGGRGGNLVPHGRRRLRFHTDRREAEPDSAGHAWKIRAAAESGIQQTIQPRAE